MSKIIELIEAEGWKIVKKDNEYRVEAYGESFPLVHPSAIHLKRYREETNPDLKYHHMKAAHDYLWPDTVWHAWTEQRFREHCAGWEYMSWAGGASTAKSFDAAKIGLLFFYADPKRRAVVVASTTLESIEGRVWGYIMNLHRTCAVPQNVEVMASKPPKLLYNYKRIGIKSKDKIHGMFAVAAAGQGSDDTEKIKNWIGRHPNNGLMVILDEATDLPTAIAGAFTNLDTAQGFFQITAIGNSNSKDDLHGLMSTPIVGWDKIDPQRDKKWLTTLGKSVCLFFSCYDSPAITEKDPAKREKLGRFLITKEKLDEKIKKLGQNSDGFWRMVLGFWRNSSTDQKIISEPFLKVYKPNVMAEWYGIRPLNMVMGLDPAFSSGGDSCILQGGILGQAANGQIVLDFRDEELQWYVPIIANLLDREGKPVPAEIQIANFVVDKLREFNVDIRYLCVDCTGQGRAIGSVIRLTMQSQFDPLRIYSVKVGNNNKNSFDCLVKSSYTLWEDMRSFIETSQIKGLSNKVIQQITSRIYEQDKNGKKTLESKKQFKSRMLVANPAIAHSPDESDACSLCVQSAINNFGFSPGQVLAIETPKTPFHDKLSAELHQQKAHPPQDYQPIVTVCALPRAGFSAGIESLVGRRPGIGRRS